MKRIKVLYLLPEFGTGGAERLVIDQCRLLDNERFEVLVCVFQSGSYEAVLKNMGKKFFILPGGGTNSIVSKLIRLVWRVRAIKSIINKEKIDIIHSNFIGPLFHLYLVRVLFGKNFHWVHTEHNPPDESIYKSHWVRRTKNIFRNVDAAVGITKSVSNYYREKLKLPNNKVHTICNGIQFINFSNCCNSIDKRKELGIPLDAEVIGVIANLRPVKNHALLLTACSLLIKRRALVYVVLVGDGECRQELYRQVHSLGINDNVLFLGYRLDSHEILQTFDVYCLASRYEGLPLSILEAWAAGKAVVATKVRGINELIDDGVNGLLIQNNDAEALADALEKVLDNKTLRTYLANSGRELVRNHYSIESMISQYESLYTSLFDGQKY